MKQTLNQVKLLFKEVAEKSDIINHYFWGNFLRAQRSENETVKHCYPMLVVDTVSASLEKNNVGLDLQITIADKVLKGHQNLDDIKSDTLIVLKQVLEVMQSPKWNNFSRATVQGQAQFFVDDSLDETSGWVVNVRLDITSMKNLCAIPIGDYDFEGTFISPCLGVSIFENGVFKETVESGGVFYYNTSGGDCPDAVYQLTIDDVVVTSGNIPSGATQQIPIDEFIPEPEPCEDATAVLKDTDGNILSTTNIESGATEDIIAPDGVVTITDTTPITLHTVNVKSNGGASQQISDSVITLNNSIPTLISTTNVKAQGVATIVAPDSTAVIKDSGGATLKSETIPSNVSEDITINDSVAVI